MAKYCDVLSPMIYPSHFFGMDNIEHPGDAPEHFIGESMQRFELITKGSGVVIRPWLQAFRWRTKTYSPEYIKVQVATAKEKGGIGFFSARPSLWPAWMRESHSLRSGRVPRSTWPRNSMRWSKGSDT